MDKLSSSELVSDSTNSKSAASWAADYASDLFKHPAQHLPEFGIAVAAISAGGAFAARRLISEAIFGAAAEATTKAAASDAASISMKPAVETFKRMDRGSVEKALETLRTRDGVEISSWKNTHIEGSQGEGLSVLRSSDLGAMQIKKGDNVAYAHKISISDKGDATASYYTHAPFNLRNPWGDEAKIWPLYKGGPFDGIKQSGLEVLELESKPRGLHFSPNLDSLTIKWSDLRATYLNNPAEYYASIQLHGKDSVMKGQGLLVLNPAQGKL